MAGLMSYMAAPLAQAGANAIDKIADISNRMAESMANLQVKNTESMNDYYMKMLLSRDDLTMRQAAKIDDENRAKADAQDKVKRISDAMLRVTGEDYGGKQFSELSPDVQAKVMMADPDLVEAGLPVVTDLMKYAGRKKMDTDAAIELAGKGPPQVVGRGGAVFYQGNMIPNTNNPTSYVVQSSTGGGGGAGGSSEKRADMKENFKKGAVSIKGGKVTNETVFDNERYAKYARWLNASGRAENANSYGEWTSQGEPDGKRAVTDSAKTASSGRIYNTPQELAAAKKRGEVKSGDRVKTPRGDIIVK